MVDQVARALCNAAGRSALDAVIDPQNACNNSILPECLVCKKLPDGGLQCVAWTSFREEAKAAILAAYVWHKKERRWPGFCKMRVLVCGGRDFADRELFNRALAGLLVKSENINGIEVPFSPLTIITGEAHGADTLAKEWAHFNGLRYKGFAAAWDQYGKAAGAIRNQQMLDEGKPDLVVAFPGGKGTADMVRRAKKAGVRVIEIT